MKSCWDSNPAERPSTEEVDETLKQFLVRCTEAGDDDAEIRLVYNPVGTVPAPGLWRGPSQMPFADSTLQPPSAAQPERNKGKSRGGNQFLSPATVDDKRNTGPPVDIVFPLGSASLGSNKLPSNPNFYADDSHVYDLYDVPEPIPSGIPAFSPPSTTHSSITTTTSVTTSSVSIELIPPKLQPSDSFFNSSMGSITV